MPEGHQVEVYGGFNTHQYIHVGAVVDTIGRVLGSAELGTDPQGYEQLHRWLGSWGGIIKVGVESIGSYGAWPII